MMDSPKILSTSPGLDLAVLESPSKAYVGSQKGASPGYETPNPPTPAGLGEPEFSSSFAILNQGPSGARKDSRTFRPFRRVTNFCRSLTRDDARFVACLWSCGTAGWNDACLGTLIPYIEKEFGIGYVTVSTLFLGTCAGFAVATFVNPPLTNKLGNGTVITLGAATQAIGYSILIAPPPFPVMPCAFVLVGLGSAVQLAQTNTYCALKRNAAQSLGLLHGGYGLGGTLSPLVSTLFVTSGIRFSYFFAVSLSVAAINMTILLLSFRLERNAEPSDSPSANQEPAQEMLPPSASAPTVDTEDSAGTSQPKPESNGLVQALRFRTSWIVAVFLCLYCGAEVSLGGWIVSFLLDERSAPASAGYVATGFWLGITLGRVICPRFNIFVGERRVVYLYIGLCIAFELVVWFARDLIATSVSVSLVGFMLGPLYPNAISIGTKILPKRLHTSAVGLWASVGATGAALFPFLTGLAASSKGTWVLQPIVVSLLAAMIMVWVFLPRADRRSE